MDGDDRPAGPPPGPLAGAGMAWRPGRHVPHGVRSRLYPEERSVHELTSTGSGSDDHPVTVAEFRRFVKATDARDAGRAAARPADTPMPTRRCSCPRSPTCSLGPGDRSTRAPARRGGPRDRAAAHGCCISVAHGIERPRPLGVDGALNAIVGIVIVDVTASCPCVPRPRRSSVHAGGVGRGGPAGTPGGDEFAPRAARWRTRRSRASSRSAEPCACATGTSERRPIPVVPRPRAERPV